MSKYWLKLEILLFERGVRHFDRKFQGEGGHPPTNFGVRKRGVVCMMLHLAVLILFWRVTNTRTDRHAMMAITRASLAPHG